MLSLKKKAEPILGQSGNMSFVLSANYSALSGQSLDSWKHCSKMQYVPTLREIN